MTDSLKQSVQQQFGANAAAYVTSSVHAKGKDLPMLPGIAGLDGTQDVLDVATAAGHTALAMAPHARHVTATDLTKEMLVEARKLAAERGVANITFVEADAERLPFPDASFDVVTCRIAAHHFPHITAFCQEAARVLKAGGVLVVVDNVAPEDDALDQFINTVEKLRDPSHFREYKVSEWERFLTGAGLTFGLAYEFTTLMDREDWFVRMNVPAPVADEIRRRFAKAPDRVKEAFAITETGFQLYKVIITGRKG